MDREKPNAVSDLIEAFGGLSKMAGALGHRNVTTIQSWRDKKRIPNWRKLEIQDAARVFSVRLPASFQRCFPADREAA